jgi:hypothetical protein
MLISAQNVLNIFLTKEENEWFWLFQKGIGILLLFF